MKDFEKLDHVNDVHVAEQITSEEVLQLIMPEPVIYKRALFSVLRALTITQ